MAPRVSIGMPVFNGEEYLEEAINSLLAQDYDDFELIICDNASIDRTQEICRSYQSQHKRIRYYRNDENLGASKNFNLSFHLSEGEFFKWASHDDLYRPAYLKSCVRIFDEAPASVMIVYPKTMLIGEDGTELTKYDDRVDIRLGRPHLRLHHLLRNLRLCNVVFGLMRAEVLRQTKLLQAFPSADHVLLAELALRGEFWEVPEFLFLRRIHPQQSCIANPLLEDRAVWFDPRNRGRHVYFQTKLLKEHISAINNAPMSRHERINCYRVAARHWLPRFGTIGKELSKAMVNSIRGV